MKPISCTITALLLLAAAAWTQDIKLPVFFLRYEVGMEVEDLHEEAEEEEQSLFDSRRHKVTLRIKEQWNDAFTTNLYTAAYHKLYEDPSDNYSYYSLNPNFLWNINDRVRWSCDFRSKWTLYEEADSEGDSKNLNSLRAKTELAVKLLDQLKIIPSFQGVFELYEEPEKRQQIYTAGIRLESRINPQLRINSRYRAILRVPLGPDSTKTAKDKHEFGINLCWDPNK